MNLKKMSNKINLNFSKNQKGSASTCRGRDGFTLLEILLVVAAIAILAGIIILAINPNKQLGDTRNSQRHLAVDSIVNAIYQYSLDHNGTLPGATSSGPIPSGTGLADAREICLTSPADPTGATSLSCASQSGGYVDFSELTTNGTYLTSIPADPFPSATSSGLAIDGSGFYPCFSGGSVSSTLGTDSIGNTIPGPDSNDNAPIPSATNGSARTGSGYVVYQDSGTHLIHVASVCAEQTNWNPNANTGAIDISTVR